ncbi:MAG: LysM peptidoglycan-binding domain-containing protein [Balneolaceae bacterium]|nr:LysM peptidoglycan-binding domain-containing protein [Balneolaceae bacterium]
MNIRMRSLKIVVIVMMVVAAFSATAIAQQKATYTVKQGETLFSISKKLEVTIAELRQWNKLGGNELNIGQELVYYKTDEPIRKMPETPSKPLVNTKKNTANTYYTVKSGDNLYTIARLHNMTLKQLKELNNLRSNQIRVGQKLAVKELSVAPSVSENEGRSTPQGAFSLYTVQRGEDLNAILRKFKMTEQEFKALNTDLDVSTLDRGQKVTILLPPSRNYENPYLQKADLQDLGSVPVSKYGENEMGSTTTNGELYDPTALTAAHSNIALGSVIFVENLANGRGIYIRINDRITGNGLKLSGRAYRILGLDQTAQPAVTIFTDS